MARTGGTQLGYPSSLGLDEALQTPNHWEHSNPLHDHRVLGDSVMPLGRFCYESLGRHLHLCQGRGPLFEVLGRKPKRCLEISPPCDAIAFSHLRPVDRTDLRMGDASGELVEPSKEHLLVPFHWPCTASSSVEPPCTAPGSFTRPKPQNRLFCKRRWTWRDVRRHP